MFSMPLRRLHPVLAALVLGLGAACTSSSPAPEAVVTPAKPAATGLAYTDPAGSGWRLVKDPASTPTRILLNLVGPAGLRTRGVGFNLKAPAAVRFGAFASGLPIQDLNVYKLRAAGSEDPSEPVALVGGVKAGNLLTVGIFQKDRAQEAQDSGRALCQIAIQFDASKGLAAGDPLPLALSKARAIPEDIGTVADDLWTLDRKMRMTDLAVAVGTLSAQ